MPDVVWFEGQVYPAETPLIPVTDRQFLFGDSVFETLRTYSSRLFGVPVHLDRLRQSARAIHLPIPWSDEALREALLASFTSSGEVEISARLMVSRGSGPPGLGLGTSSHPRLTILARALIPQPDVIYRDGVKVIIPEVRRIDPRAVPGFVKSGNYLNHILALEEGRRQGAFEVVMVDGQDQVSEGSTSNVFFVSEGRLYTPSLELGCLPGITRGLVLGLAVELGLEVRVGSFSRGLLEQADELFITSSLKELVPVTQLDDRPLGPPGPVTLRLLDAFRHMARERHESDITRLFELGSRQDPALVG